MFTVQWISVQSVGHETFRDNQEQQAHDRFAELARHSVSDVAVLRSGGVVIASYYSGAIRSARMLGQ